MAGLEQHGGKAYTYYDANTGFLFHELQTSAIICMHIYIYMAMYGVTPMFTLSEGLAPFFIMVVQTVASRPLSTKGIFVKVIESRSAKKSLATSIAELERSQNLQKQLSRGNA